MRAHSLPAVASSGFWAWPGWIALTAIGTFLLSLGVGLASWAIIQDRRATQMAAVIDLIREHRSAEMRRARNQVRLLGPPGDPKRGIQQLNPDDREAFERVTHFLDSIALLVLRKLLKLAHVRTYFGLSILNMWDAAGPYVYSERHRAKQMGDLRRVTYLRHFEDLAAKLKDQEAATIASLERLRTVP